MCYILYLGSQEAVTSQSKDLVIASYISPNLKKNINIKQLLNSLLNDIKKCKPEALLIDEYYLKEIPWLIKEVKKFYGGPVIICVSKLNGTGKEFVRNGASDYILDSIYDEKLINRIIERSKKVLNLETALNQIKSTIALAIG